MSDFPLPKRTRLKPVSRSTNNMAIRNLKCFKELHRRLILEAHSIRLTAKWLKEDMKEMTEMSDEALVKALHEYRKSVPAAERAKPMNVVVERAAEEIERGLDELEEMNRLYKMQMARIEIDFQTEKNIKKLLPTMTQEIRTAREILSASAQLKMDLGLNERHLGKVDVETTLLSDVAEKYADSPAVAKVLDDGESRRKVLGLAERLLAIADRAERHPEVADQLDALAEGESEAS